MAIPTNPPARFDGQQIFGDMESFAWSPLVGGPAGIDAFLGNAPGTTLVCHNRAYALSGAFIGPTQADVQAQIDLLESYANVSAPLGFPTDQRPIGLNFQWAPWYCYFLPREFKPGAIQPYAGNQQASSYFLVMRSTG
jgi:hypothetical protein